VLADRQIRLCDLPDAMERPYCELGQPKSALRPHLGIFLPEQIGVAQELLPHRDRRTPTVRYHRARGVRQAANP
jgi:hypothetical protein